MTEPTGWVVTLGLDGPDIVHLNPTAATACGGRVWNASDPTIEGSSIVNQQVDEKTALGLLEARLAIACRRCEAKTHVNEEDVYPSLSTEGVG